MQCDRLFRAFFSPALPLAALSSQRTLKSQTVALTSLTSAHALPTRTTLMAISGEVGDTFESRRPEQIDEYWRECDTDRNARLDFEEWLPCAGAYSDNGERFIETSWDDLVQEVY